MAVLSALTALVASLTGCGSDARRCEELYVGTIGAVEGVASVAAECNLQFGGGWQRVDVHLDTDDAAAAGGIGEEVLRALAAEPEMDAQWATPRAYYLSSGAEATIGLRELGFNGVPDVGEVREHYGIDPS